MLLATVCDRIGAFFYRLSFKLALKELQNSLAPETVEEMPDNGLDELRAVVDAPDASSLSNEGADYPAVPYDKQVLDNPMTPVFKKLADEKAGAPCR
jgi:hypothetical protein